MHQPIILALDVESAVEARTLINTLGEDATFYKVGLELYTSAGMDFVRELAAQGKQVFLDLKLYDIGETVKRAVAQITKVPGIRLLTIHAMKPVMQAAVAGRDSIDTGGSRLELLGVTVLTSFDENDLREMGYRVSVKELVDLRVKHAMGAGMDGVVCSPLEVAAVRRTMGENAILVTPGVRSAGAATGDQKRVATPAEALRNGATHLVIGRQVTRAADPRAELRRILAEIEPARSNSADAGA